MEFWIKCRGNAWLEATGLGGEGGWMWGAGGGGGGGAAGVVVYV